MISIEHESFFLSLGSMSSLFGGGRAFVKVTKSIGEWGGSSNGRAVVLFSARRWMFDSSPLHINLFGNRSVGLSPGKLLTSPCGRLLRPWGWTGPASPSSAMDQLARSLGIEKVVSFRGWLRHEETMQHLGAAEALV